MLDIEQVKAQQHINALRSEYRVAKYNGDKVAAAQALRKHTEASNDYRVNFPVE